MAKTVVPPGQRAQVPQVLRQQALAQGRSLWAEAGQLAQAQCWALQVLESCPWLPLQVEEKLLFVEEKVLLVEGKALAGEALVGEEKAFLKALLACHSQGATARSGQGLVTGQHLQAIPPQSPALQISFPTQEHEKDEKET